MKDIQLTKHFKLSEFVRSDTAVKNGIQNVPSLDVVSNLQCLCQEILEPLREWMNKPIHINSGYRSPALNKAVGGISTSQHMSGEAADIRIPDKDTGSRYVKFILGNCRFDQLLYEHDSQGHIWLHVSCKYDGTNRQNYIPNYSKN